MDIHSPSNKPFRLPDSPLSEAFASWIAKVKKEHLEESEKKELCEATLHLIFDVRSMTADSQQQKLIALLFEQMQNLVAGKSLDETTAAIETIIKFPVGEHQKSTPTIPIVLKNSNEIIRNIVQSPDIHEEQALEETIDKEEIENMLKGFKDILGIVESIKANLKPLSLSVSSDPHPHYSQSEEFPMLYYYIDVILFGDKNSGLQYVVQKVESYLDQCTAQRGTIKRKELWETLIRTSVVKCKSLTRLEKLKTYLNLPSMRYHGVNPFRDMAEARGLQTARVIEAANILENILKKYFGLTVIMPALFTEPFDASKHEQSFGGGTLRGLHPEFMSLIDDLDPYIIDDVFTVGLESDFLGVHEKPKVVFSIE